MEKQIKISKALQKAREYEENALTLNNMSKKQDFHVCAPVGWINDPNGFSEYQGEIHLFFQYHPYDIAWGPMHWGHVTSKDFIQWTNMPPALAPDEKYDNFGCFSGSAIEVEGKHVLAYTSVERVEAPDGTVKDYQRQSIAIGDGVNYEKIKENPVITSADIPHGDSEFDFRDPKIWLEDSTIYMVVANRNADNSGQILLYSTKDLKNWNFEMVLDKCINRYGRMWECPDFFKLEGTDVLIVSPQEMRAVEGKFHAGDCPIYITGDYDKEKKSFTEKEIAIIDGGLDFYAPQTMKTSDGRRIMIAWMQAWCGNWFEAADGFCGMMTVPRELHIKDGKLLQLPVYEIEKYYTNKVVLRDIIPAKEYEKYDELSGRIQNMDIVLESSEDYCFALRIAADDTCYTTITYDKKNRKLSFDRSYSGVRRDAAHERKIDVRTNSEKVTLRVLMDRYSVEVFVNDGEHALSSVIRTPFEIDGVYMKADAPLKVGVTKHDIVVK